MPPASYMLSGKQEGGMKLDDAILEELERGRGTVREISERLSKRVYDALERLADQEKVAKKGHPGKGNEKVYSLPKLTIKRRA